MVYAKSVWPFLFLVLPGIAGGCAARQSAAPWPHQYALAEKMAVFAIKDFGKVNEYLYRGAQPKEEGIAELKKLGIDTIVDLRGERHGLMEKERAHAESLGMRLVSIPGTGWTAPKDKQIAEFFAVVSAQPRRRIFVHCWFGGDRGGMFIAAYRIAFDGWTADEALHEMHTFHYKGFLHPNMAWYVKKFPERLAKSPVLAGYRQVLKHDETEPAGPAEQSRRRKERAGSIYCAPTEEKPAERQSEVRAELAEGWEDDQLAGAGHNRFVFHVPGVLVRDINGVEADFHGGIDVAARAVADHPALALYDFVFVDQAGVGDGIFFGNDFDGFEKSL